MASKRTVYQRIMRAADLGTGLRLTSDDVAALALDDAISYRADCDDVDDDE